MAILAAFNSPEVEVVGLTSLFGNVRTPMATANAVFLRELADRHDVRALPHANVLPLVIMQTLYCTFVRCTERGVFSRLALGALADLRSCHLPATTRARRVA